MEFYGKVAYHHYEGAALDLDEQQRLVAYLEDKNVMILRNHGLLTGGRTVGKRSSECTTWKKPVRYSSRLSRLVSCCCIAMKFAPIQSDNSMSRSAS